MARAPTLQPPCISWGSHTVWDSEQTDNLLKPGVNTCFNLGLDKNGFSRVLTLNNCQVANEARSSQPPGKSNAPPSCNPSATEPREGSDQAGPLAPSDTEPLGKCLAPCTTALRAFE